jgi:hypothetical protein
MNGSSAQAGQIARQAGGGLTVMLFDGVDDYVSAPLSGGVSDVYNKTIAAKIKTGADVSRLQVIFACGASVARIYLNSGEIILGSAQGTGFMVSPDTEYQVEIETNSVGNPINLRVDGITEWTGVAGAAGGTNVFYIGARDFSGVGLFFEGSIYEVEIAAMSQWDGYGAANADWVDNIGSNDGTVFGSPTTTTI